MGKHFTQYEKRQIEQLHGEGLTHKEIGEQLGYERMQIKEYFHRLYKKQRAGIKSSSLKKGRPRKKPLTQEEQMYLTIRELQRENELLKSFLLAAGRRRNPV